MTASGTGRGQGQERLAVLAKTARSLDREQQASVIRPYGDTTGDGMVQVSFTLPMSTGPKAEGAALQLAAKMGLDPAMVVHAKGLGAGESAYTFFVVYGRAGHLVDLGLEGIDAVEHGPPTIRDVSLESGQRIGHLAQLVVVHRVRRGDERRRGRPVEAGQ